MRGAWLFVVAALAAGCKGKGEGEAVTVKTTGSASHAEPAVPAKPEQGVAKKGSLARQPLAFFAVIVPKGVDRVKLEATAKELAAKHGFRVVAAGKAQPGKTIVIDATTPIAVGFKAGEPLGEFVPESDRARIEAAPLAFGIVGAADARGPKLAHDTALVAKELAEASKGWIMDLDLQLLHLPGTLLAHVPGETKVDVRDMVILHGVSGENDLALIDTAGMTRLGLPELQIRDVPPAYLTLVSNIVNATAQTLAERDDLTRDGELVVDVSALGGDWAAAKLKEDGGTAVISWRARWGKSDHGDEPVLELSIPGAKPGTAEALLAAIDTFAGKSGDSSHTFDYDDELKAAGVQARAALTKLRPHFAKGMPPKEQLAVKAPFATDDGGIEWMWVDVVAFKGDLVDGILDNTPDHVSRLKSGQRVQVKFAELADFIHKQADGKRIGGYSLEVMRKHGEDIPPL